MAVEYSVDKCKRLEKIVREADLHYTHGPSRYDPGTIIEREITGVFPASTGRAKLEIDKFVGGGFAGQVYRARLLELDLDGDGIPGLNPGLVYAIKIIVPPTRFSRLFRNAIFWLAYQGPFPGRGNAAAARTGVLWQKLFRRGARLRFGDERSIVDTYATFFDPGLGSYGEINEWVEGRVWKFEIDEHIFKRGKAATATAAQSAEYLAKKQFMAEMVRLCHDMGAPEFARQYEWWTCKSQPNVLKRTDAASGALEGPGDGLTAIDFRAGLALLPFLPMSPADIVLIIKGLARGDLVQFDRGDLEKLEAFCDENSEDFEDLEPILEELKLRDPEYRASLLDFTHHWLRPLVNRDLRRSIKQNYVQDWSVRGLADGRRAEKLKNSFFAFWCFLLLGVLPLLGNFLRRCWGQVAYRRHISACLTSLAYLRRRFRANVARTLADWHRSGRVGEGGIDFFLRNPATFWFIRFIPGLLPLPPKWHRFLTDPKFAWTTLKDAITYPVRFYRDADFRVEWLTGEVGAGADEGMLTPEEKQHILSCVTDPYIQKYLKCVAVHLCTLPITQVVSALVAVYAYLRFGETWEESLAYAAAALAIFQVLPISPGSLVRGTYVVYLMIKERNVHNYWIAVLVSYWHYVGYLGFPLQMVSEFPALSRFMAGRWATGMVHYIPVFGERGALLEHWAFDLFFNVPLSIKGRFARHKG